MIFYTLTEITFFSGGNVLTKGTAYFALDHWHEKVIYTVFTRNISEVVRGQVFFLFLSLKILSKKSRSSLSPSHSFNYISQEYHNYSFAYLHKAQSDLILVTYPVIQIWIHKPNSKTRKFCTLNSYEKKVNKSYTLVILLLSNLCFLQI